MGLWRTFQVRRWKATAFGDGNYYRRFMMTVNPKNWFALGWEAIKEE
jgi:hypothetical protein